MKRLEPRGFADGRLEWRRELGVRWRTNQRAGAESVGVRDPTFFSKYQFKAPQQPFPLRVRPSEKSYKLYTQEERPCIYQEAHLPLGSA